MYKLGYGMPNTRSKARVISGVRKVINFSYAPV